MNKLSLNFTVFWNAVSYNPLQIYKSFGNICYLHLRIWASSDNILAP